MQSTVVQPQSDLVDPMLDFLFQESPEEQFETLRLIRKKPKKRKNRYEGFWRNFLNWLVGNKPYPSDPYPEFFNDPR